jgi:hypothetical protein
MTQDHGHAVAMHASTGIDLQWRLARELKKYVSAIKTKAEETRGCAP